MVEDFLHVVPCFLKFTICVIDFLRQKEYTVYGLCEELVLVCCVYGSCEKWQLKVFLKQSM